MATIWTIDVNEGEEVELTVAEEKEPGMVLMLVSDAELDAALVGVSRANAGRIGAALTHFSKTGELPEEGEEDADCTDCCKALPVYDFALPPSRHQRAAEEMQEEWERGEEER